MSAVATLAATIVAAAGAVAAYRYVGKKTRAFREAVNELRQRAGGEPDARDAQVIDYERDPSSGVYRPKDTP